MCGGGGGGYTPPPPPPPPPTRAEVQKPVADYSAIERKRKGRSSTIMTQGGAQGLVGMENIQKKKLMGSFSETQMDKVDNIIKRMGQLESMRGPWEQLWQDCTDFVNPRRGDFSIARSKGDRTRYDKVFDSTAPLANEQLASGLHGFLTSSAENWFSLNIPQENDILSQSVRNWLQGTTETLFDDVFHTPEANFTTAVHELYLDL